MKRVCLLLTNTMVALTIFSQPVINSFSPASGAIGTSVIIKGSGFSASISNNVVYFGSVRATIAIARDTALTVTVPAGASYAPLTVTTNNLTAYSQTPFLVTFAGDNVLTAGSFMPRFDLKAGIYPHAVSIADFNNDGKNDLLVCKGSSSTVSVFQNTSTADSISFKSSLELTAAGNSHECSAVADIDGDGKLDFVTANTWGTSSVSVFRNTSASSVISFAGKLDFNADNAPYSVSVGDLDQDGKPDLIIANGGSNLVNIYRNTSSPGNISFDTRIDLTAGSAPYSVAVADIDGDGKPELIYTTQGSSGLYIMKNSSTAGSVSFDAPVSYASIGTPFVVVTGDLDGDGKPDVAASSGGGLILVLPNTSVVGTISFADQKIFSTGGYTVGVAISDINGDGKPDLLTANRNTNNSSALRNTSTAGNISFDNYVGYAAEADPFFVAAADLNNDGRPDICVANSSSENVSILKNLSGANVVPVIASFTPTAGVNGTTIKIKGTNFTGITAIKFGGTDAATFVVDSATGITATVGAGTSGDVTVTNKYGTGTLAGFIFNGPTITAFAPSVGVAGTLVTITGTNFTGATAVSFGNTAAASFTIVSSTTITAVVGAGSGGNVAVNTPTGTASLQGFSFGPPVITSFSPSSGPVGTPVTINGSSFSSTPADNIVFFGAVKGTVVAASATQVTAIVPTGTTYDLISITANNSTAASSLPFTVTFSIDSALSANSFDAPFNVFTGAYPFGVAIKDLDNDGKPDLVAVNGVGNSISVVKNTSSVGHISFDQQPGYAAGSNPERVATGDLDGDGKPDVAVTNFNSGNASTVSIYRNTSSNGTISLADKTDLNTGNGTIGLVINDMDGDGKPDLMTASGNSGFFSFFKNSSPAIGTISFAARQDFTSLSHGDNIKAVDLNADNQPDLIVSNFSGGNISIYQNTSNGGFFSLSLVATISIGNYPGYITTADVNGDGKPDIAVSSYNGGTAIFVNRSSNGVISINDQADYSIQGNNVSFSDLDGDGRPDAYAGATATGITSIFMNKDNGNNNLFANAPINFTTGNFDSFTNTGDIDGDGRPELLAVNTLMNTVAILRNKTGDPVITSLSDSSAVKGQVITIMGHGFSNTTSVTFGGVASDSFAIVSPARIDARVSSGASGTVTVTTAAGIDSVDGFRFLPQIKINSDTVFCNGYFALLTSTAADNNQWYKDGIPVAGSISDTVHATTSGVYSVKTTNEGITTTSVNTTKVAVTTIPAPVVVKDSLNNLISNYISGNQWYRDGVLIPGATEQTYKPDKNGNYTVTTVAGKCTSDTSIAIPIVFSGAINLGNDRYIALYPNPVGNELKVNWNFSEAAMLNVSISDLSGNLVLRKNVTNGSILNISNLRPGIYMVRVYSNDGLKFNKSTKIIKGN